MALPQLIAEDVQVMDRLLADLVSRSESIAAILIDKAGFLIIQSGQSEQFDSTTLAALAAGSFAATQGMASVVSEPNFNSVYQQGESYSLLVQNVESDTLLLIVFAARGRYKPRMARIGFYGRLAERLNNSTQSPPCAGEGLASHSLMLKLVADPSAAAALVVPGVGVFNCQLPSTRPME